MIIVVGSAIVTKDDAILFVREIKPAAKDKYGLPGGKLEDGEALEACVIRECKEETGLDIHVQELVAITQKPSTHEGNNVVRFFYTASLDSDNRVDAEMESVWLKAADIRSLAETGQIRGKDVVDLTVKHLENYLKPIPKPILFS